MPCQEAKNPLGVWLRVLVEGGELLRSWLVTHQVLKMSHGLRGKQDIGANGADLGRYVLKHKNFVPSFHRMNDETRFILTGTILNAAFHRTAPLSNGVTHLGGRGSYTVMTTATSSEVVQTTWTHLPRWVLWQTKAQAPRLCCG